MDAERRSGSGLITINKAVAPLVLSIFSAKKSMWHGSFAYSGFAMR